jgi:hypothetical protein
MKAIVMVPRTGFCVVTYAHELSLLLVLTSCALRRLALLSLHRIYFPWFPPRYL